jgi:hypothetical protein
MLAVETSHKSRKLDVGILRSVSQECLGVHLCCSECGANILCRYNSDHIDHGSECPLVDTDL